MGIQYILGSFQTVLPKASVTDVAVRRTGRYRSTSQDVNSSVVTAILNPLITSSNSTSISLARTGTQEIISPRRFIIAKRAKNSKPLDTPIIGFSAVHGQSTSILIKVIGLKTVLGESADVYARRMMDFARNSVISKSPNFMDLGLLPAHTMDKLDSVIDPATRVEGLKDGSDWLASMHGCKEVTVGRVSEAKVYSDYIKKSEFETTKVFERGNISVTPPTENIPLTRTTEFETLT